MLDDTRPDPTFKQRMNQRLSEWYHRKNPDPDPEVQARRLFLASLVNKSVMTGYIGGLGLPLPRFHAEAASLDQLDFAALPSRVVIKPNNGADSKGVILLDGEVNRMNGDHVPLAERARYVRHIWAADKIVEKPGTRVIAEEFLQDYDPAFAIPRDFKVFAAKGRCGLIQVIDRNPEKALRTNSFFTRDWSHIDRPIKTNYRMGPAYSRPADLQALVAMAERISADIQEFYRLDFYMTTRGPVFGEFTSYPSAGEAFTPYGDRLMCQMMDTVRPAIPAPVPRDDLPARFVQAVKAARLGLSETESPTIENWQRRFHHVVFALNRRSQRHHLFRDKLAFDGMVRSAGMDAPETLAVAQGGLVHDLAARDRTDPETFLARHEGAFFIKDRHGASGRGAYAITAAGGTFRLNDKPSTRDEVVALLGGLPYAVLIQRRLEQHPLVAALNPSSINSVRVLTMFGKTCREAEMLAAAIRIGRTGNFVDNLIGGGSSCVIDPVSGTLRGTPRNNQGVLLSAEQRGLDTFEGYRIPHFHEAVRRCLILHELVGPAPETIGWDVAITPDGPVILEGNMYWDPTLHEGEGNIAHAVVSRLMQPGFSYWWKA